MKDASPTLIHPREIPPPTHNGHAIVDGEDSENPTDVAAARFNISVQKSEMIFQYFDETMNSGDQMLRGSLSNAVGEAVRQRDREWMIWLGKIFLMLDAYTTRQSGRKFMRMTILTMGFVLGCGELIGIDSFSAIAHRLKMPIKNGKQAVNKCAATFLEKLALAPMLTQRTEAAKQEMANSRNEQFRKTKN